MSDYHPRDDGFTHLNIYSKAATSLGRALSNFSKLGFEHPLHGWFQSMEAYWYYVSTGMQHDDLRPLSGYQAKQWGRQYPRVPIEEEVFQHHIRVGLDARFAAHPWLRHELALSTLPLVHYYYWGNIDNPKVVSPSAQWVVDHIAYCRDRFRGQEDLERIRQRGCVNI